MKIVTIQSVFKTRDTAEINLCIGIPKLGLKGRQDIAGGEAPCKDNKKIQAPKGRQGVLFS